VDWSWLLTITKRIAAAAPRRPKRFESVSSDKLYHLGIELMDKAVAEAEAQRALSKATDMQYRDGLLIAMMAVVVPRLRTVTALKNGTHLIRSGELWLLEIPPEDVKGKRALDFTISAGFSRRIDLYLGKFRPRIPGAEQHTGLWASNKAGPMSTSAIYNAICTRTEKAFGYRVNPHRFRHAAGTLWSIEDPENVRGVKDLLGHASYDKTTETHYVMGQSRMAGRTLAKAIDSATR
jgi:integrase